MHIEHSSGHTQNFSGYSAAHARRHGRVKRMPGEGSLLLPKVGLFEVFQVADGALSGRAFDARRLHRQSWTQGSCQGHGKGKQGSHNMKSDCLVCKNDDMGASAVYSATRSCPFSGGSVWVHIENFKTSVWVHIQFGSKENFTNPGKVRCNTSPQNWEELRERCCNEHLPKFINTSPNIRFLWIA